MSPPDTDGALDALFLPLAAGDVALPAVGPALFLRARAGAWLRAWPRERFACVQTFKPFADALARAGVGVIDEPDPAARFPLVFVLPPRQREESRALLARAVRHAVPGGIVVACQANNEGARSMEADLERLAGTLQSLSKHKCRVAWTAPLGEGVDAALVEAWIALDAPRPIADGRYLSRPGLFAWDRIDTASALLAAHLPATLAGRVADLGAGYGYLAAEVVRRCPRVEAIDLYEAERRALEPARLNLERAVREASRAVAFEVFWHDVAAGLPQRYDAIVSNPPFHQGRADQPELGRAFIAAAAAALRPHGSLWLVANRHLAYEATLAARFATVRVVDVRDGFKVIEAKEPRA
ncbi:MAG: class I SAM-dependent methyltransferase [Rhodanobacteraceae bacterium]|jgi:16S rRNA (guanine1207-N2)-methyltransferase|nr:class I SAM-dependent methyltransferase [Rhodanobacteraceae bacterium]